MRYDKNNRRDFNLRECNNEVKCYMKIITSDNDKCIYSELIKSKLFAMIALIIMTLLSSEIMCQIQTSPEMKIEVNLSEPNKNSVFDWVLSEYADLLSQKDKGVLIIKISNKSQNSSTTKMEIEKYIQEKLSSYHIRNRQIVFEENEVANNAITNELNCVFQVQLAIHENNKSKSANPRLRVNLTGFVDSRGYSTFGSWFSLSNLRHGFKILGFHDLHSEQAMINNLFGFNRVFTEYRISNDKLGEWLGAPFDIQVEFNSFSASGSRRARFGIQKKINFQKSSFVNLRFMPIETDEGGQFSLFTSIPFINGKFRFSGFFDLNVLNYKTWDVAIVSEPALRYFVTDHAAVMLEYRWNSFENRNLNLEGTGIAVGLSLIW